MRWQQTAGVQRGQIDARLVLFDSGLDLDFDPEEFYSPGEDMTRPPKHIRFYLVEGIEGSLRIRLVDGSCSDWKRDWTDSYADRRQEYAYHGTKVAIRAVGLKNGVYAGAPLTVVSMLNAMESFPNSSLFLEMIDQWAMINDSDSEVIPCVYNISWSIYTADGEPLQSVDMDLALDGLVEGIEHNYLVVSAGQRSKTTLPSPATCRQAKVVGALGNQDDIWPTTNTNASDFTSGRVTEFRPQYLARAQTYVTEPPSGKTSFASPVLAAKLLFLLHTDPVAIPAYLHSREAMKPVADPSCRLPQNSEVRIVFVC